MQSKALQNDLKQSKHERRGLPVTLAAALALIIFGGLAIIMTRTPQSEPSPVLSGAASQDETSTMENQLPTAVDPIAQTSTAIIAQGSQQAATAFAPMVATMPPSITVALPDLVNGLPCQIVDPRGTATVHNLPDAESPIMETLPAESRIEVSTVITNVETGTNWLYVEFVQAGLTVSGWVRESDVRILAICFYTQDEYALLTRQLPTQLGVVITPVDPFQQTATAIIAQATYNAAATQFTQSQAALQAAQQQLGIQPSPTFVPTVPPPTINLATMTFTPTFVPSPTLTPTPTITATATHTGTPFVPPTQPTITPIQVRVADAEQLDMEALIGQQVDLFIAVGEEDTPVVVPVARGVTVQEFVEVPMPNETRYVFIDAIILPRSADQAELLAGLSQTHIPMKMVLTG